jgi:hypothetical protein
MLAGLPTLQCPFMAVHGHSFHALLNTAPAGWASTPPVPLQSAGRPAPPGGSRWAPCLCRTLLIRHPVGMCWQPLEGPSQLQQQTRRVVLCRAMNVMTWIVTGSRCMSTGTQVPHATDTSPRGHVLAATNMSVSAVAADTTTTSSGICFSCAVHKDTWPQQQQQRQHSH